MEINIICFSVGIIPISFDSLEELSQEIDSDDEDNSKQ